MPCHYSAAKAKCLADIMIDTHTHIYEPEFDQDRDDVVKRAVEAGVDKFLLPCINQESIPGMKALAQRYPQYCHTMTGLHPEDVHADWQDVLDSMWDKVENPVAVGEVGLDFYWDDTFRKEQIDAFEYQICKSVDMDLPLVIHMRNAEPQLLDAMERHKADGLRGIFHCFGGSRESARRMMRYEGFVFGIGGVVTFRNSRLAQTLSDAVPLDRIVLETDAPYLAPVPHRGHRNEPSFLPFVAAKLAQIYNVGIAEIDNITTSTAQRLFSI